MIAAELRGKVRQVEDTLTAAVLSLVYYLDDPSVMLEFLSCAKTRHDGRLLAPAAQSLSVQFWPRVRCRGVRYREADALLGISDGPRALDKLFR